MISYLLKFIVTRSSNTGNFNLATRIIAHLIGFVNTFFTIHLIKVDPVFIKVLDNVSARRYNEDRLQTAGAI